MFGWQEDEDGDGGTADLLHALGSKGARFMSPVPEDIGDDILEIRQKAENKGVAAPKRMSPEEAPATSISGGRLADRPDNLADRVPGETHVCVSRPPAPSDPADLPAPPGSGASKTRPGAHPEPRMFGALSDEKDEKDEEDDIDAHIAAELKKRYQVDLNKKANLANLEDKGLQEHMGGARARLAELERKRGDLPSAATLHTSHAGNLRILSDLVTGMADRLSELQTEVETTFLQSTNATKLAVGDQPYGFPEVPGEVPVNALALRALRKKLDANANKYQDLHAAFTEMSKQLFVFRRNYEATMGAVLKIVDYGPQEPAAPGEKSHPAS
jgi:hypothetical protein